MARLRAPDGCPWDRQQTAATIRPYLLEETYEVIDAIDRGDDRLLAEELGDLMLQAVFLAQMAAEQHRFTVEDSLDAIAEKLIRRHPHVFADGDARTADQVKARWDQIKQDEKRDRGEAHHGLLDGVSRRQPALMEAQQVTAKAASVGFDWENARQVLAKLDEELRELEEARRSEDAARMADEIGDLLFTVVNLARLLKIDAEQALRAANAKFRTRFGYIEARLRERARPLGEATLPEMDELWNEAKRRP